MCHNFLFLKQEDLKPLIFFFLLRKAVSLDLFSQLNLFSADFTPICGAFWLEVILENASNGCVMVEM